MQQLRCMLLVILVFTDCELFDFFCFTDKDWKLVETPIYNDAHRLALTGAGAHMNWLSHQPVETFFDMALAILTVLHAVLPLFVAILQLSNRLLPLHQLTLQILVIGLGFCPCLLDNCLLGLDLCPLAILLFELFLQALILLEKGL